MLFRSGKGWLPLLDIDHPPLATLIREFYLNLSVHSNDSNTQFVKSWIQGKEYVITPSVVASALGVPKVQQPVYPYDDPVLLMTLCYISRVLPFSGVLILGLSLMS